jgi:hypothetical protein
MQRSPLWMIAGGVTMAAAAAGVAFKALHGSGKATAAELASFAAASVANAARGHMIHAIEAVTEAESLAGIVSAAGHAAVREAAEAGADITAAAIGAVEGARMGSHDAGLDEGTAVRAALDGIMGAARGISGVAESRVADAIRQVEQIEVASLDGRH